MCQSLTCAAFSSSITPAARLCDRQAACCSRCLQLMGSQFKASALSLLVPKCRHLCFLLLYFILFLLLGSGRSHSASSVMSASTRSELKCPGFLFPCSSFSLFQSSLPFHVSFLGWGCLWWLSGRGGMSGAAPAALSPCCRGAGAALEVRAAVCPSPQGGPSESSAVKGALGEPRCISWAFPCSGFPQQLAWPEETGACSASLPLRLLAPCSAWSTPWGSGGDVLERRQ